VVICTGGRPPDPALNDTKFPIITTPITRLEGGPEGNLAQLRFATGDVRPCAALFFPSDCNQRSSLPEALGCDFDREGSVVCKKHAATNVPGLYVAGNVRGGVHLAIMAAAEGAEAALAMNAALRERSAP
jgi:thioredoxin reductase